MTKIEVESLEEAASRAVEAAEAGERVIVTRDGRPAAVIMSMEDAEDVVLAEGEEFVQMRSEGRDAYARGQTTSLDDTA